MHSIRPRWALRGLEGLRSSELRPQTPRTQSPFRTRLTQQPYRNGSSTASRKKASSPEKAASPEKVASPEKTFQQRLQMIKKTCPDPYPRLALDARTLSVAEFKSRYDGRLAKLESVEDSVVVSGRIRAARRAGGRLMFFDLLQDGHKVQVMYNLGQLNVEPAQFMDLTRMLRRGDAISVTGKPHRTGAGELTVSATEHPQLLAPCLHDVPAHRPGDDVSPYPRHVQFLVDPSTEDIIRARSALIQYLRQFFLDQNFMEVSTPIIGYEAGGALARPFYTSATEFPRRQLSLRIAPELWLKRLVVGGFDKVFEIGPSFRNEGLDKTHNAEFTTCEFYYAYANLEDLMTITENLLSGMYQHIRNWDTRGTLQTTEANFSTPFRRIDFIPEIESHINRKLPDLTSPDADEQVKQLFHELSLPIPVNATLPRLLDELSSIYLEPTCRDPTFIINPPECLSPLSKSFIHPTVNQPVAARGELFIEGKEVVNTYEEENSPFEQRRKFEDQLRFSKAGDEQPGEIDESYVSALEWGLPSTGGWGCGVDRLVMLFTGATRINDVLPFGNLRSVTRPSPLE